MHTTDARSPDARDRTLDAYPQFELRFLFDDGEDPTSVTIFAPESLETTWMTADRETAVDIEDVR